MRRRVADSELFKTSPSYVAALTCGGLATLLGLVVIISWHARLEVVLVLNPAYPAMQYNTAVAFVLSGVALLLSVNGQVVPARALALVVAVASVVIFIQDPLRLDLGIDRLLFDPYITTATMAPGRMAPHTAITFALTSVGIAFVTRRSMHRWTFLIAVLGSVAVAVGMVALVGYVTGFQQAYGWGRFTKMAVHTAGGFVILGSGLFAFAWGAARSVDRAVPQWLFIPVTIGAVAGSIVLAQALVSYEDEQIELGTRSQATTVQHEVETEVESHIAVIERIARRWENQGQPEQERWESEVRLNFESFPGLRTIAWVDQALRARWVVPEASVMMDVGSDLDSARDLRSLFGAVETDRQTVVSQPLDRGRGELEIFIVRPIVRGNSIDGYVVGVFGVEALLGNVLNEQLVPDMSIAVFANERNVFERSGNDSGENDRWGIDVPANVRNQVWELRVRPDSVAPYRTLMPYVALAIGCLLAGLLGLVTWLAQHAATRSRALQQANLALQSEVVERTSAQRELLRSSAALEQSNRALQEFAYVASHDLKAPLVSLQSLASMLRDDTRDILQGEAALYLERIVVNAGKMRQLLDDLLEHARLGRGSSPMSPISLNEIVDSVTDQLSPILHEQCAEVVVNGTLPVVSANPVRLHQVFANLITNAVQYTPPDRTARIEISAAEHDDMWQIAVVDNGAGIPLEYHEKVFTMFQRLPKGRSLNPNGTGMGLAIVARVIESWGGRCWISGSDETGTSFCMTLPKVAAHSVGHQAPPPRGFTPRVTHNREVTQ